MNATAGIYATYPQDFLNVGGGVGDQVNTLDGVHRSNLTYDAVVWHVPIGAWSRCNHRWQEHEGELASLACCLNCIAHKQIPQYLIPLHVGLLVAVIGMAFGFNCGYAINPARDLGPRLFTLVAGFGSETFRFVML